MRRRNSGISAASSAPPPERTAAHGDRPIARPRVPPQRLDKRLVRDERLFIAASDEIVVPSTPRAPANSRDRRVLPMPGSPRRTAAEAARPSHAARPRSCLQLALAADELDGWRPAAGAADAVSTGDVGVARHRRASLERVP